MAINLANKNLPVSLKEATLASIEKCRDSGKYKVEMIFLYLPKSFSAQTLDDKCMAAYEVSKCVYEADPEVTKSLCYCNKFSIFFLALFSSLKLHIYPNKLSRNLILFIFCINAKIIYTKS